MNKFTAVVTALQSGNELANAATWKNRQLVTNAVAGLLGAVVVFLPLLGIHLGVSDADISTLAGAVGVAVGLFNAWATAATSKKVGLPAKSAGDVEPGRLARVPPAGEQPAAGAAQRPAAGDGPDDAPTDPLGNDLYGH